MAHADTCVAYLVRRDEGLAPVRRFLESYVAHDSGVTHQLVTLRRGFRTDAQWFPFAGAFEDFGVRSDIRDVAEVGFDLGAYREVIESSTFDAFCFLNTFSELLCDGWLAHLHRAAHQSGVGLVGATGSYESAYDEARDMFQLARARRRHLQSLRCWVGMQRRRLDFVAFPNPHIRTNGFLVRRPVALQLRWGPWRTKYDALRGESGRLGFSRQAHLLGLDNLVVGCDGLSYQPEGWPLSRTFRCADQSNLLIADNRTRQYDSSTTEMRERLGRLAWGERYVPA